MDDSERLAVAAHLHVVLRRKTGRVTDTEWMACNQAYSQAMVTFAREHARAHDDEELERLAQRLMDSWGVSSPAGAQGSASKPSAEGSITQRAAEMLRTSTRYIGGLR